MPSMHHILGKLQLFAMPFSIERRRSWNFRKISLLQPLLFLGRRFLAGTIGQVWRI